MRDFIPQAPRASSDDTGSPPLEYVDVFMDDFILQTQGPPEQQQQVRQVLLECLDSVIRPLDHSDRPKRKEAASTKKLLKGDGCPMATLKTVLDWLLNTEHRTVQLPKSRVIRLNEILDKLPREKKRVSKKIWYQVLGELRSMVLAIPGGRGLFSALQRALWRNTGRIRLNQAVHDELDDWRWLTRDLHSRPTSWDEFDDRTKHPPTSVHMMQDDTVWAVYGLEILLPTILHCGDNRFHPKLLPPWLPTKTLTVLFQTQIWN